MHVFLETERLVLRRFTENDADLLVDLDSDPEVMYFITGGRQTPRREIEMEFLPAYLEYYERYAGFGFWAAIERSSGEFAGWFHFRPESEDDPGQVELGYRLRRSIWGMGYATEGSRALIEKGFVELGVERVYATTMVVNVASRRVMEKAGATFPHSQRGSVSDGSRARSSGIPGYGGAGRTLAHVRRDALDSRRQWGRSR